MILMESLKSPLVIWQARNFWETESFGKLKKTHSFLGLKLFPSSDRSTVKFCSAMQTDTQGQNRSNWSSWFQFLGLFTACLSVLGSSEGVQPKLCSGAWKGTRSLHLWFISGASYMSSYISSYMSSYSPHTCLHTRPYTCPHTCPHICPPSHMSSYMSC